MTLFNVIKRYLKECPSKCTIVKKLFVNGKKSAPTLKLATGVTSMQIAGKKIT